MDRYGFRMFPIKKDNMNRGNLSLNIDFLLSSSKTALLPQSHQYQRNHYQGRQRYALDHHQIGEDQSIPSSPCGTISFSSFPAPSSSPSSSLDSCLGSFPFRTCSGLEVIEMTSKARDGSVQALFSALPTDFQTKQALVQGSLESNSTFPSNSALEASECSIPQSHSSDDAVSSSDDAMCSSPLMAEVKGRRFQVGNLEGPLGIPCRNLSSSIDSRQLEAISQWQEGISPPVPALPSRFQIETTQSAGWIRSEVDLHECQVQSEVVRVDEGMTIKPIITNKDLRRISMTSSSRKATTIDMSEQSLDTCINSIGTYASTLKSQEGHGSSSNNVVFENTQGINHGIAIPMANGLFIPARNTIRNDTFAYNGRVSEANSSFSIPKECRPHTATRRIAFSPSVRIGKCADSSDPSNMMDSFHGQLTIEESHIPISQPVLLPTFKSSIRDIRSNEGGKSKKKMLRPLTAPDADGQARQSFRNMLRPLSRQNREGDAPAKSFLFGRPISRGIGAEKSTNKVFDRPVLVDSNRGQENQEEVGRYDSEAEQTTPTITNCTENGFRNKSERETIHSSMNTHRRSLLDGCPTYAETMATRYEADPVSSGGSRLAPTEESIRSNPKSSGVIKRVVSRLTEAFSSSSKTTSGGCEEDGDSTVIEEVQLYRSYSRNWAKQQQKRPPTRERCREFVKQSKSFLRPMTAPYADAGESNDSSRPMSRKGGDGTESKKPVHAFQMISRYEPNTQPSILMGKQFRSCEQLRNRHLDQEQQQQQRLNTAKPSDQILPSIPCSKISSADFSISDCNHLQRQAGMSSSSSSYVHRCSSSSSHLMEPPINSFTGRVALVPISRVSKDDLKRMQPVRIVKCAETGDDFRH